MKVNENPYSRRGVIPCEQTDRHDEDDSRFFAISRMGPPKNGKQPTTHYGGERRHTPEEGVISNDCV